jgi:hypothetical protein
MNRRHNKVGSSLHCTLEILASYLGLLGSNLGPVIGYLVVFGSPS